MNHLSNSVKKIFDAFGFEGAAALLKARTTKYFKRTGTPGKYKYYYTQEQYEKEHGEEQNKQYVKNSKNVINNYTHYKSGDKYHPRSEWAKWFLAQDRKSKEEIAYNLKTNDEFRNALISNWYDYYKNTTNSNINYNEFLNKEISIYRGETSRDIKYGSAKGFSSYTTQKELAKHFSEDGNNKIIELKIKPKDTYGMIDSVGGEIEILIPTTFSEEFMKNKLDDYSNSNIKIFDKLNDGEFNKFSELEDNKQYEDAINLLKNYVKKYK